MISGRESSRKNFLMNETFEYAKERVANRRANETIDGFRLFNNLLSSQPMAFNLFYPLMLLLKQNPAMVTLAVKSAFKNLPVFWVTEIRSVTEYLKSEYTYKLSAVTLEDFVDAMIQYLPEYYAQVYERFRGRYLEFGKVDLNL